ncbi:MAG: hypothetical protein DMG67_00555 [Acidobacteria bacterium]|nr:MAG: hypothetical protein DMG67_00555 [Acidobacteriota bacterium]
MVEENVERRRRPAANTVFTRDIHFGDIPSLTCRNDEIVSSKAVKSIINRFKILRRNATRCRCGVIYLIIEHYIRCLRHWRVDPKANRGSRSGYIRSRGKPGMALNRNSGGALGGARSNCSGGRRCSVCYPRCGIKNLNCLAQRLAYASLGSPATARLRQRKRYSGDGQKQKKVKCASEKMRFGGGINLLFHFGVVLSNSDLLKCKIIF